MNELGIFGIQFLKLVTARYLLILDDSCNAKEFQTQLPRIEEAGWPYQNIIPSISCRDAAQVDR